VNVSKRIAFGVLYISVILAALTFAAVPSISAFEEAEDGIKLPILMYHQVSERSDKWGKFVISPSELERDIRLLAERGFTSITVDDLIAYTEGKFNMPEKPVMLTFDDGYQSDYIYVLPLLKKYRVKAVCSTVGAYSELYSSPVHKHVNYAHLSWNEMREMAASGLVEFQNHSYNLHNYDYNRKGCLKKRGESEWHYDNMLREDFELSQQLFMENVGVAPTCFTYPFGSRDDALLKNVKDFGFKASLGAYEKVNVLTGDPEELYDLRRFNRPHGFDIDRVLRQAE